ncbi:hypothetical protein SAMN03159306_00091 [Pseudomonas sp. NFACC48-1]|nr:hypothetical protein SAMN03159424_00728 [Pseudomonas sp. NFACC05-1]SCZ18723.1 hypothetical protein SAMN03159405_00091 [Pseudomonas sp. NFACC44-2]SDA47807.1 hypothetical protein SAMN03159429_00810 [Pseudomonas sp. NFACC51]SEI40571.1 hypothetical protein SAMN03159298_00092 [Pseudomonas sp. NFACC07-1]SFG99418.1 hypothetical protein SAMN03159302_00091 [Pseudomonas sp. NFACC54]SFL67741.1 hypothetical protein SAMN03159307_03734 [Pseudomonas sp. NFACC46-3]SFS35318.1 hypothetical protein SAMN03159
MRILKALLLPFLLILSLIGVDRPKTGKPPLPQGVGVNSGLER